MKKVIAVLLAAALIFILAGCDLVDLIKPESEPDMSGSGDSVDAELLWSALDGIWVSDDGQFVFFGSAENEQMFSIGILNSGYAVGGPLNTASKTGENAYTLLIDVPSSESSMENEGWDAYTLEIALATNLSDDPRTIDVTDITLGGSECTFVYAGKEFEDAASFAGSASGGSAVSMTQDEAWDLFDGIWCYKSNDLPRFAFFSGYDGSFSCGTLFSGDAIGGQLTSFTDMPDEKMLTFDVYSPALSTMEMEHDEVSFTVMVDYSMFGEGILSISAESDGVFHECRYIAKDFTGIGDIDHVLAQLP